MDSSLQSAGLTMDDLKVSVDTQQEETAVAEEEHHIHLPNPSLWPLLLSAAIVVTIVGLMFIPDGPWLSVAAAPFILVGILGWALEDPMVSLKAEYIVSPEISGEAAKFKIGQDVLDKSGEWLGTVQARFSRYILVDRGGLSVKVYYVPPRFIEDEIKNNVVRLKVSELDLLKRNLDTVPDDLYEESADPGIPQVKGVPLFARGPLSPAETGHYNYGPNFPGINTDAAGSYFPEEIRPVPQKYVGERRNVYNTRKNIPPRVARAN
jgi:hypothetical protein